MEVRVNGVYHHFKGNDYRVLCIATDSTNLNKVVVYKSLKDGEVWVRPYEEFNSLVDKTKYPDVKQKSRFELK